MTTGCRCGAASHQHLILSSAVRDRAQRPRAVTHSAPQRQQHQDVVWSEPSLLDPSNRNTHKRSAMKTGL
ncbi:unnamed protein product [Merluccius merluccius]